MVILLAACTENRVLGQDNAMPWHLPRDLAYFRAQTLHQPVIMGRQTFVSMGRALPQRQNIVVSRQANVGQDAQGVYWCQSPESALQQAQDLVQQGQGEKVFVIGGGQMYQALWEHADELWLTHIHTTLAGDTFFPDWRSSDFTCYWQERAPRDEKNAYDLTFARYRRRSA